MCQLGCLKRAPSVTLQTWWAVMMGELPALRRLVKHTEQHMQHSVGYTLLRTRLVDTEPRFREPWARLPMRRHYV